MFISLYNIIWKNKQIKYYLERVIKITPDQ